MKWYHKVWKWIRRILRLYEKEIKMFVDNLLEMAFERLEAEKKAKLTPAIRKKIRSRVLADILIMGIDVTTAKGKSAVGQVSADAIDWFLSEEE